MHLAPSNVRLTYRKAESLRQLCISGPQNSIVAPRQALLLEVYDQCPFMDHPKAEAFPDLFPRRCTLSELASQSVAMLCLAAACLDCVLRVASLLAFM